MSCIISAHPLYHEYIAQCWISPSTSRHIVYQYHHPTSTHKGLFHVFATGSSHGTSQGPNPNKIHEQIGWAFSPDGVHFTQVPWNPVVSFQQAQPHTIAMAEGHVWFDDERGLVVVFHTVRWDRPNSPPHIDPPFPKDPFAPDGRNAEDLGYSLLIPSVMSTLSYTTVHTFRHGISSILSIMPTPTFYLHL